MKVLHVLNGVSGGAARSVAELVRGMDAMGVTSSAICHRSRGVYPLERQHLEEAFDQRVEYTDLYHWHQRIRGRLPLRPLMAAHQYALTGAGRASVRQVMRRARELDVDLIHTNTFTTRDGAVAAWALGIPHVWHVRELVGDGQPFRFYGGGRGFAQITEGSRFVVNSPATRVCFEQLVPTAPTRLIPNGLHLDALLDVAAERREQTATDRPMVVGMVANLTSTLKRHDLFIDAAAACSAAIDLEFVVYGADPSREGGTSRTGRYAAQLHRRVEELGLSGRFSFAGYHADPVEIMREIDILVVPNEAESFGRVAVEAMASGVCAIAADSDALRFVLDDGKAGVLVPPRDPAALAAAIVAMATDRDRRRALADVAEQRAVDYFSVEQCAAETVRLYEEALAVPRPARAVPRGRSASAMRRALGS